MAGVLWYKTLGKILKTFGQGKLKLDNRNQTFAICQFKYINLKLKTEKQHNSYMICDLRNVFSTNQRA